MDAASKKSASRLTKNQKRRLKKKEKGSVDDLSKQTVENADTEVEVRRLAFCRH